MAHFPGMVVGVQLQSQSPMLSPSDTLRLSALWSKDKGNSDRSHPVSTYGSQGFPHLTSSGHWPYGIDFQEMGEKRRRGVVFVEPGPVCILFTLVSESPVGK